MSRVLYLLYKHVKNRKLRALIERLIVRFEDGYAYSPTIRRIYRDFYRIEIGYGTIDGCFSLGNIRPNVVFGNYCSIASGVKIFRANHPYHRFTTHPILYDRRYAPPLQKNHSLSDNALIYKKLTVGHDVWIGANAIILPGCCNIGNGAIIGAGSIVTKDVPPYSIVAGNPARMIRMRFPQQVIASLEASEWWLLSKAELSKYGSSFDEMTHLCNE